MNITKKERRQKGSLEGEKEIYQGPKPPVHGRIIGLDCHPDIYTAAVFRGSTPYDARKECCREDLSLEGLLGWVKKEFTGEDLFLLEAGGNSFEVVRKLMILGLRAVVLESAHVGKYAKDYEDNDRLAAARIVRVYLGGNVPCVWVPDAKCAERRELLHAQQNAVADHTAAGNRLKGFLNQFTIRLGKRNPAHAKTREWVLAAREWPRLEKAVLEDHFAELDYHAKRRREFTRLMIETICGEPLMLRCMRLLGIGIVNAFALLAIIGEVRRFNRPEQLVAYVGLNPGRRTSGTGKNIKVGVGKRGRKDMRHLLIQSGHNLLRSGKGTALGKWGWKLFARKGNRNIAVVAIARKLLVQVWHVLMGNPPTVLDAEQSLEIKLTKMASQLGKELREQLGLPLSVKEFILEMRSRLCGSTRNAEAPPQTV